MPRAYTVLLCVYTAGRELYTFRLSQATMLLSCKVVIPNVERVLYNELREAAMVQLRELTKVLKSSEGPIYFQADGKATTTSLDFNKFVSLVQSAEPLLIDEATDRTLEQLASFWLLVPLVKALEVMGLGTESVGSGFSNSPLQCTPEGKRASIVAIGQ